MKINFSKGTVKQISSDYWNLTLVNENGAVVYKATLDQSSLDKVISKHPTKISIEK